MAPKSRELKTCVLVFDILRGGVWGNSDVLKTCSVVSAPLGLSFRDKSSLSNSKESTTVNRKVENLKLTKHHYLERKQLTRSFLYLPSSIHKKRHV